MGFYNSYIYPHVLNYIMSRADGDPAYERLVIPVFKEAEGDVLEIGMGAGRTLPMYDPSKVKRLVGIEPNAKLASVAVETGEALPFPVEVSQSGAEEMDDFEDATFDTILSSAVMCSVPDLEGALAECRRVLKPSGKLVFAEHGRSPDRFQYLLQRLEEPIHRTFVGGCHMTTRDSEGDHERGIPGLARP